MPAAKKTTAKSPAKTPAKSSATKAPSTDAIKLLKADHAEVKTLFRDQYMLVRLDEERAVRAIPRLLPESEETRRSGIEALLQVLGARGNLPEEGLRRLRRIEELFGCASREIPAGGASLA